MQKQSAPNSVYLNSLQKWIRAVTEAWGRQARVQPPPCSPCSPPAARQGLPAHAKRWGRRGGRKQASAPSLLLELTAPISGHWVPGRVVWGLSGPPPPLHTVPWPGWWVPRPIFGNPPFSILFSYFKNWSPGKVKEKSSCQISLMLRMKYKDLPLTAPRLWKVCQQKNRYQNKVTNPATCAGTS